MKKYTNLSFSGLCINPSECMNENQTIAHELTNQNQNLIYKPGISFEHNDYVNQHMFDEPYSIHDFVKNKNLHHKSATERYNQALQRSI